MSGSAEEPPATDTPEAFYEAAGDGFESTVLTRGPWNGASQHAGPPAALLGRGIEMCAGIGESVADRHVARVTFEILRPVPIARLRVEAEVVRPGRRVDMVEATLSGDAGEPLVRARAWRMLRREVELPQGFAPDVADLPAPPESTPVASEFFPTGYDVGYHTAMEYRFVTGSFIEVGPATTWMRMRVPVVAGEEPTPLQRVLAAADSGNGISSALDYREFVFINVDLTVHLHRPPAGEWVCLDSVTVPEPSGVGMTDTKLWDEGGPIGRAVQSLLVDRRPG